MKILLKKSRKYRVPKFDKKADYIRIERRQNNAPIKYKLFDILVAYRTESHLRSFHDTKHVHVDHSDINQRAINRIQRLIRRHYVRL